MEEMKNTLQENVTCAVCFEIYTSPYALKCLHTFCYHCIQNINIAGRIHCPECREWTLKSDIKKDFKIQGFVDIYRKQACNKKFSRQDSLTIAQPVSFFNCDMCAASKDRCAQAKCLDCDQYMCSACIVTHNGIKICKSHRVAYLDQESTSVETSIKQAVQKLKDEKLLLQRRSNKTAAVIADVQKCQESQKAEVNKYTDEMIRDIECNRTRLHQAIKQANEKYINHLHQDKHQLDSSIRDIQDRLDYINTVPSFEDPLHIRNFAIGINAEIGREIQVIREQLQHIKTSNFKSPVTVEKGAKWDVRNAIQVKVKSTDEVDLPGDFNESNLDRLPKDDQITHVKRIDLGFHPHRLYMINGQLWCLTLNAIHIYDRNCLFIKKITNPMIRFARGFATMPDGKILIACSTKKGLIKLDSNGDFQEQILNGSFADVCIYQNHMYILETEQGKVVIYTIDTWMPITEFPLTCGNIHARDRLFVKNDEVYISSSNNNCLYVHTLDGELKYQTGETGTHKAGYLSGPLLCNVDSHGNALVADYSNHRLQVYERCSGWCIVILPGRVNSPVDGITDEMADNTWIVTQQPDQLLKITV